MGHKLYESVRIHPVCDRPFRRKTNGNVLDDHSGQRWSTDHKAGERSLNDGTSAQASCLRFHRFLLPSFSSAGHQKDLSERTQHGYPLKLFATHTYDEFISTLALLGSSTFWSERPTELPGAYQLADLQFHHHVRATSRTANGRTNATPACSTCTRNAACSALPTSPRLHGKVCRLYAFHQNADAG